MKRKINLKARQFSLTKKQFHFIITDISNHLSHFLHQGIKFVYVILFVPQDIIIPGPGGYSNYFSTGCAARGLKPLPISKDFSPSKIADLTVFPKFSQIRTHF